MKTTTSRLARGAVMTVALLVGTLILPGTADVSDHAPEARKAGQGTASQNYGWAPSLFDFAWEYGESLTDRPGRGTKRQGRWVDVTTGSGRAARHNGGLMLESKYGIVAPADSGPGDHGSTTLTLQGNPQTYGRWELRGNVWGQNDSGAHYTVRYSLVPEKDPDCTARSITIAQFSRAKDSYLFGAFTPNKKRAWRKTMSGVPQGVRSETNSHAYAVEVGRDHISWFLDGRVVGVVRTKAAIPKVPLTLRLSLIGSGSKEMQHTYVIQDWIRGFPIGKGTQVRKGPGLKAGKHGYGC